MGPLRGFIVNARASPPREEGMREEKEGEERVLCLYTLRDKIFHGTVNIGSLICVQELSR